RRSHRDDPDGTDPLAGVLAGPRADRSDAGGPSAAGASGGGTAAAGPSGGGAAGSRSSAGGSPASRSRADGPPADGPLEYVAQSTGQGAEPAAPDTSGDAHEKENPAR